MTTTSLPRGRDTASQSAPPPRRPFHARVSGGHLVMLVAGLVAMLLNYHVLRAGEHGTPVAVLERDVPAGEPVTADHVRFVEITAGDDVLSALVTPIRLAGVSGHVARADLRSGDMLHVADLQPVAAPGGRRAMSIPVPPEHAVAGRLQAGDRVDVIEVRDGRAAFLLSGALVLDVTSPDVRAGITAGRAFSMTLAVDEEEALRLALAIREGHLEVIRATGARAPGVTPAGETDAGAGARGHGGGAP